MPKFLVDENIANSVSRVLAKDYDIKSVKRGISDDKIIKQGLKENRIILTHDKDFGNLLEYPLQKYRGVVLIRLRNQSPDNVIKSVVPLFKKKLKHRLKNVLIIIKEGSVRIIK